MGHARTDVFRRHYLHQTVKVDTQSAYLGSVDRGDLVGTVGLMSAKRDPRAPVKLSPGDLREHKDYPKLAAIVLERDSLGGDSRWNAGRSKQPNASYPSDSRNTTSPAVKSVHPRHA